MMTRPPVFTEHHEGIDVRSVAKEISMAEMCRFLHEGVCRVRVNEDLPMFHFLVYAHRKDEVVMCKISFDHASKVLPTTVSPITDLLSLKNSIDTKLAILMVEHVYNHQPMKHV